MNCSKIIKNNKKNIGAEEDKKPFKVFYFAQIFEKLSVKFTDRIHFHPLLALTVDWGRSHESKFKTFCDRYGRNFSAQ